MSSAVLQSSLREQRAALRGPDAGPPPDELLDLELLEIEVPGGALALVKPRDWPALREAEADAGRPAPYWATMWPSGVALARHLAGRDDLAGRRVLELGCGLGVASAAAARQGAEVLATDIDPDAVAFAAHVMTLNDVEGEVALASWPELAERHASEPFDLVVAADVLYRRENAEQLARLLPLLVADGGEAVVVDPGRTGAGELWPLLRPTWTRDVEPAEGTQEEPDVRLHRLRRRAS